MYYLQEIGNDQLTTSGFILTSITARSCEGLLLFPKCGGNIIMFYLVVKWERHSGRIIVEKKGEKKQYSLKGQTCFA